MHTKRAARGARPGAFIRASVLALLLSALGAASAQGADDVPLQSGTISVEELSTGLETIERVARERADRIDAFESQPTPERIIIQFDTTPSDAERRELEEQGIRLLGFIGNGAYFATVESHGIASLRDPADREDVPAVRGVAPMRADFKLEETVQDQAVGEWAVEADGTLRLRVTVWSDASLDAAMAVVEQIAEEVLEVHPEFDAFVVRVAPEDVRTIAELNDVQWVEPVPPPFEPFNDDVLRNLAVMALSQSDGAPTASGIRVGVWDGGLVAGHDDFTGRLTELEPSAAVSDHATHVAGTVGGTGSASPSAGGEEEQWRGVAPGAEIFSADFHGSVPSEMIQAADAHELHLTTNSWGYRINEFPLGNCHLYGRYDALGRDFDAIVRGSDDRTGIPILFAAGNERDDRDCGMSPAPPFENYGVVSPPSTAKNVITVGAVNSDDDSMTAFSSWGPVEDGRVKPEVVAPGCQVGGDGGVTSTVPGNGYGRACGTSMATPAAAGVVALALEAFTATHGGQPLPATVKAVLIDGAVDLGAPGPDFRHGYGRIDAQAAVEAVRTQRIVERTILDTGEVDATSVAVPAGAPTLRVTLAWDDVPATAGAAETLVNDLDLVVLDPAGVPHRPFVLNPSDPGAAAGTGIDSRNVVEQVRIDEPEPGSWNVEVRGTRIAQDDQPYALVVNVAPGDDAGVTRELDELRAALEERVGVLEEDLGPRIVALEEDAYTAASASSGVTAADVVALGRDALELERELHDEQALVLQVEESLRDVEQDAVEVAARDLSDGDSAVALTLFRVEQLLALSKAKAASLWQQSATIERKLALARNGLFEVPGATSGAEEGSMGAP